MGQYSKKGQNMKKLKSLDAINFCAIIRVKKILGTVVWSTASILGYFSSASMTRADEKVINNRVKEVLRKEISTTIHSPATITVRNIRSKTQGTQPTTICM